MFSFFPVINVNFFYSFCLDTCVTSLAANWMLVNIFGMGLFF